VSSGDEHAAPLVEPSARLTPLDEVERRLAALQDTLAARELDAALILQNADLYYYSGTVQQGFLYVPVVGAATLFARKIVDRARLESPLRDIVALGAARDLPEAIAERHGGLAQRIGLELDVLPVTQFRRLEALFAGATFADVGPDIVRLRAVKSPWEIDRIRAAAALADEVFRLAPGLLEEGLTEAAFAGCVEAEARRLGHEGVIRMRGFNQEMFYGQLLSGASGAAATFLDTPLGGTGLSPAIAQGVSFKPIRRRDHVLFDFVAVREGYIADFTRILALGRLPRELARAYDAALRVQEVVKTTARPGVTCAAVWAAAETAAEKEGLAAGFMGRGEGKVRFVGHGVGLELDELPVLTRSDLELAEGMVFALEPKFVLPGLGAIGVENTWHVTAVGIEALTRAPEDVVEVAP
jgi:Xaa-Pro aminopeptidase